MCHSALLKKGVRCHCVRRSLVTDVCLAGVENSSPGVTLLVRSLTAASLLHRLQTELIKLSSVTISTVFFGGMIVLSDTLL